MRLISFTFQFEIENNEPFCRTCFVHLSCGLNSVDWFQIQQYLSSQDEAKKAHLGVWQYGDITEDDDKEFGLGR